MKKATKAKKPRKCSVCGSIEHRADFHGKKADRQAAVTERVELQGDDALRLLIMPDYALYIVLSDQIGVAIQGAVRGYENSQHPGARSTSLVSAFSRLAERASRLDRKTLTAARSAWQQLQAAQDAYSKAVEPIKAAIIPKAEQWR